MSATIKSCSIVLAILMINALPLLHAQDKLPWLDDYTGEMVMGNDTYQYEFTDVNGNECKIKIEERVTDKKGAVETRSWIFYLSDMDPSKLTFKAKGKSLVISMETNQSQKFITYLEEGEIDGYTQEINISMNEVEMVRSFLEILKKKIETCEASQTLWENRDQAFTWLMNNVGKVLVDEVQWDQKLQQGSRDYLVDLETESVNGKGERELSRYLFDLTDIDPAKMNLRISGKTLTLEMPVKDGNRYIRVETPAGTAFTNEMLIHADDIELARQIFNAFKYVLANTTTERLQWDSYAASLGFIKDHLGEVGIAGDVFSNSLNFDDSPSAPVDLTITTTESDGTSSRTDYLFYLADLMDHVAFEVSKNSITLKLETENKRAFIREMKDGNVTDYSSAVEFHVADIDMARDIVNAFEHAIGHGEEKIEQFSSVSGVGAWFSAHVDQQNLSIDQENENQLTIERKLMDSDGTGNETKFIVYPEDISLDKLDVEVSGNKLFVPLVTGRNRYIKNFENGQLQDFTGSVEVLFTDPLLAKNFVAAIRFLKENSVAEERSAMSKEEAKAFILENIQGIELPNEQYEQALEARDGDICNMSFTRVEIDEKGPSVEYLYEFIASDIHPGNSKLLVKGEVIQINLVTVENEKLIKPYKNGEPGDFVNDFIIYADDVLLAKKLLAAFAVLAKECE